MLLKLNAHRSYTVHKGLLFRCPHTFGLSVCVLIRGLVACMQSEKKKVTEKSRTWSLTVIVHSKPCDNSSVSSVSRNHLYCAGGKTKLNQWDTSLYSWMNVITRYAQGFLKKPNSISFSWSRPAAFGELSQIQIFLWLWRIKACCERWRG